MTSTAPPVWKEDEWEHVNSLRSTSDEEVSGTLVSRGFQRHLDQSTGCYFLYNPSTGESLWEEDEQAVLSSVEHAVPDSSGGSEIFLGIDPNEPFDLSFENESTFDRIWSVVVAILEDFNCDNLAMLPLGVASTGALTLFYVSASFCAQARDCGLTTFPTLSYAVEYGGSSARLMWQYGLLMTGMFMMGTTAILATRFRNLVPLSWLPRATLVTGLLTAASLFILSGASLTKQHTSHSIGTVLYWGASWLFIIATYRLRRIAWRDRRPVLPPPFDVGGRCPANKWTACAAAAAVTGGSFALAGLFILYTGHGEFVGVDDAHPTMSLIGLVQQVTVLSQLLFVGSLWAEVVATGVGAAHHYSTTTDASGGGGRSTSDDSAVGILPSGRLSNKSSNKPKRSSTRSGGHQKKGRRRGDGIKDSLSSHDVGDDSDESGSDVTDEEAGGRHRIRSKAKKGAGSKKRAARKDRAARSVGVGVGSVGAA